MSDRKRARHARAQRAQRRADRWEVEFAAARTPEERLNIAYRWLLAEIHRDKKNSGLFGFTGRADPARYEPAIEAMLHAARNRHPL